MNEYETTFKKNLNAAFMKLKNEPEFRHESGMYVFKTSVKFLNKTIFPLFFVSHAYNDDDLKERYRKNI